MRYAQLRAFHAVARHGGFSRAAASLALTQPAISDHVRKLEETYGVQLFVRSAQGVTLTDLGRSLFAIAERQFESEAEAVELLSRAKRLEVGQLLIGADAAVHILPQIARFRSRFPGIAIRLSAGNSSELLARLAAFTIDLAVTAERPSSDAFVARRLGQDRLVAVAGKNTKLGKLSRLTFAKLAQAPLIIREEGSVTRRLLLDELRLRGLSFTAAIETDSREAAREAAAQGLGCVVMPEGEVVPDTRLKTLIIDDWNATMEEWLICLRARAGLLVIRSFFEELPNMRGQR